jgi:hypothetical protein
LSGCTALAANLAIFQAMHFLAFATIVDNQTSGVRGYSKQAENKAFKLLAIKQELNSSENSTLRKDKEV